MKTLSLSLETVNHIAELNLKLRQKGQERKEKTDSAVDRFMEYITDPLTSEMNKSINDLPDNQKQELAALVWCGRGDFDTFAMALEHAESLSLIGTANYLSGKPLFEYIPKGIVFIENEGIYLSN